MTTEAEMRQKFIDAIRKLEETRNDMIIGVTAALLDLYRMDFEKGLDTKTMALARLRVLIEFLKKNSQEERGSLYLQALVQTLEEDKLDAAKLLRIVPEGTA